METINAGLWKESNFLTSIQNNEWEHVKVIDNKDNADSATCQVCDYKEIRFIHVMKNKITNQQLLCGCICAQNMINTIGEREKIILSEAKAKNIAHRIKNITNRNTWKKSKNGKYYIIIEGVYLYLNNYNNKWQASIAPFDTYTNWQNTDSYVTIQEAAEAGAELVFILKGLMEKPLVTVNNQIITDIKNQVLNHYNIKLVNQVDANNLYDILSSYKKEELNKAMENLGYQLIIKHSFLTFLKGNKI